MLTLSNYTSSEKAVSLFVTFIFVIFFFQFFRKILLEQQLDNILIQTIFILLWYGLSLSIT